MPIKRYILEKTEEIPDSGLIPAVELKYVSPTDPTDSFTFTTRVPGQKVSAPRSISLGYTKPFTKKKTLTKTYIMDEFDTGCISPGVCESEIEYKNSIDPYDTFRIKLKSKTELLSHPKSIKFVFKSNS